MKKTTLFFTAIVLFLMPRLLLAGTPSTWKSEFKHQRVFIENKGQFHIPGSDSPVVYAYDGGSTMIYFTKDGATHSFLKTWKKEEEDKDREEKEGKIKSVEAWKKMEAEEHRLEYKTDMVGFTWENANPSVEVNGEDQTADYHSYTIKDASGKEKNINFLHAYHKIIYKNLYPHIDVEYVFHEGEGIKYSIILHPGADPSVVKMKYDDSKKLSFKNGDLKIKTVFGNMTDHAPVTFYEGNTNASIESKFVKNNNTVSFQLGSYDASKTVVIDPWSVAPSFATNWDCVWECEKDGSGNVYIIGGVMPLQLIKYNSAGAVQWTYNTPYDTTSWLGTMATDLAGNSYVTQGSVAAIIKVNTSGSLVWSNPSPGGILSSAEFWNISFNCDQTKLVIGGTGGSLTSLRGVIYDVDMATGNVLANQTVGYGAMFSIPTSIQEVRSITAAQNGKYYFLTLDTIGSISTNFSLCPSGSTSLNKTNSGFAFNYKCENYRYDNSGIMAIRANGNFVYTNNGTTLQKRSLTTFAVITSVTIPGGASTTSLGKKSVSNSGIDIDDCGNVYVGSSNAVLKYDANLTLLSSSPTTYNVYDVNVTTGGSVIACGSTGTSSTSTRQGTIQQFDMSACAPMVSSCCNATICTPPALCATGAPITLQAATAGGTWSGTGVNPSTGVFSPSVSGPGTFTITYTLACGSDAVTITVSPCATLTLCQGAGGTATVSGGTPGYTWQSGVTTTPCVAGLGSYCGPFTVAGTPTTTWTTFSTSTTATLPGTYPIQVLDANGTTYTIADAAAYSALPNCTASCPPLTITPASQVNVSCFGGSTGSFSASTSGGVSPYDYTLMNGATTVATFTNVAGSQSFTGLAAGTYTLNVLDDNGCPGSTTITITQPASAVSVAITGSTTTGCATATGTATAQASGGSSPWDYVWTGASGTILTTNNITTSNTVTGLAAGTYTITITDNNGCTTSTTVTITTASGPSVAITASTNVACFGGSTGSATANASSGASPYDYVWTSSTGTVQTDNNITVPSTVNGLAAGTYTVTVTDNGGCTATQTVTITQPATATSVSITGSTTTGCGTSTGSATAQASGGTSPWDYVWTGASGTLLTTNDITGPNTVTGLATGTYTITITDANGCTANTTVVINSSTGPSTTVSGTTNILCFGGSTGAATVNATGGASPYDYVWSNSGGTVQSDIDITVPSTASGLAAGTYTVVVTDNGGCTSSQTITLTQPASAAAVTATSTPASCGTPTGTATATASGGTGPYDYVWTDGTGTLQTTNNISTPDVLNGLAAGTYTVTITDNNGCTAMTTVSVTNSSGATTSITSQTDVACFGGSTGSATANATGGTSPYDYVWTNSTGTVQTDNNISVPSTASGLTAGTYTVTVTDNGGCVSNTTVTITQPATAVTVTSTSATDASCGSSNGTASVVVSGGTVGSGYTYAWSPSGGSAANASSLAAGVYTITITDGNGCTADTTITINNAGGPSVSITSQTDVLCNGGTTGAATANASGGTGSLTYAWSGGAGTSPNATNLSAGTYTVTVTDGAGCSNSTTVTITQPTAITASVSTTTATCGVADGSATVTASGGTGALTYVWTGGPSTATYSGITSGSYTVTVTDGNGCSQSATGLVGSVGGPNANAGADVTITSGSSTTLTGSGPAGSTFSWSPSSSLSCSTCSDPVASPTQTTIYYLTVTQNGCTGVDTVIVYVDIVCGDLFVPQAFSPNGDGHNDVLYVYGACLTDLDFAIYDRWGERVFETTDQSIGWDGTYKNKLLDAAVFVYYLKGTTQNGEKLDIHGNITLVK